MSLLFGTELNPTLINLLEKRIHSVIIATLDSDYHPHTAPFHFITVSDPKHLRLAISKHHQTYRNLLENIYVAIAVLDEGDIAVSIKGSAQVIKEAMETDCNMAIVEIEIGEILKNNSSDYFVTHGIRILHKSEPILYFSCRVFQELLQFTGNK